MGRLLMVEREMKPKKRLVRIRLGASLMFFGSSGVDNADLLVLVRAGTRKYGVRVEMAVPYSSHTQRLDAVKQIERSIYM